MLDRLEVEEALAESVFVYFLCFFCLATGIFFAEVGCFPGVDFSLGVVVGGESFFFADGGYPVIDGGFVGCLQLVESESFYGHGSPLDGETVTQQDECTM
jgi:hypothetical protein